MKECVKQAELNYEEMKNLVSLFDSLDKNDLHFIGYEADYGFFEGPDFGYAFDLDYWVTNMKTPLIYRISQENARQKFTYMNYNRHNRDVHPCMFNGL